MSRLFWLSVNNHMYKLNKLEAQIQLLKNKLHKYELYEKEQRAQVKPSPDRIADAQRAQTKVREQIKMWEEKLEMVRNQVARVPSRTTPLNHDQGGPLIG